MGRIHVLSRMGKEQMTTVFLSETDRQNDDTTVCVVCNKTYNEKEQGWTYSSFLELYTCSNECYSSEQYNQLLNEESPEKG